MAALFRRVVKTAPRRAVARCVAIRWLTPLWLLAWCILLPAQIHKVDPKKTVTFPVAGATAAYSLDSFLAEANAENGVVSITGINSGSTHVVVATSSGVQTFEVLVTVLPPVYPAGFVLPVGYGEAGQGGYWEGRYYSNPAEIQNQLDFFKTDGDNWTHVHLVETNVLGPLDQGESRTALSSATYQIVTPTRDLTLFDKYVDESQLTINGSIVRGFHLRQGNWFVHAGYTTVATFEGLFLPIRPELVVGGGYIFPFTENSSVTGSFYRVQIPSSDLLGHTGNIGDLRYKYKPRENFWFTADLGISRGVGGAAQLLYRTERDDIVGLVRYMPLPFASLGANNLRGLHSDIAWTRHVTKKFELGLSFYNNNLVLPGIKETTISGAANLRYQFTRHWAATGGAIASSLQATVPPGPPIRDFTLPAGLAFQSKHFGATGQYQFAVSPGFDTGGKQFRASVQSGWGAFRFTGYAERDTNAPTLSFIFGQVTGLQQLLNQQGIQATTVQQVDALLSSDAYLIAGGYIKGASINLVPVRTLAGGTADWASRGVHRKELSYTFLYNDNQALSGSTENVAHTLAYTQSVTRSDNLSMSCSIVGTKSPGQFAEYTPICFISWRHLFQTVPYFIIPERRGTITGNVFRDDQSTGELAPGMRPMPQVEIMLDDRRRTLTRADGSYRFPNVPRGKHRVEALFHSPEPFFFTTTSDLEVEEDATVNFGIAFSLSGLMGHVRNDAGQGVPGVSVAIRNKEQKWSAVTEEDGTFYVASLAAGDYDVQVDGDSLPAGYSADALVEPRRVTVGATSPGNAAFTARAFRSISGRVLRYDPTAAQYVPVIRAQVVMPGLTTVTDAMGRYLFRDLAAGSYTLSAKNGSQNSARTVLLSDKPVDLTNVDFQIAGPAGQEAPAPVVVPRKPQSPSVPAAAGLPNKPQSPGTSGLEFGSAAAQRHNYLGRQLTREGRYRDAIVELTEALRIAPDFALAFNARGFALVMLHEWARAIEDLDQAIRLNPNYRNAFQIRAIARKNIGDMPGAAADLTRSQQLSR